MFGLSAAGSTCRICGKALANPEYHKDEYGRGIYWVNPNISDLTDVRVDFCGVNHSNEWFTKQLEARKNVTPGD